MKTIFWPRRPILSVSLLVSIFLSVNPMVFSQTPHFLSQTFHVGKKEMRIRQVLDAMSDQTRIGYSWPDGGDILDSVMPIEVSDIMVEEFLRRLTNFGVVYTIDTAGSGNIHLSRRRDNMPSETEQPAPKLLPRVEGIVVDERRNFLVGITVFLKGTQRYTQTDQYGGFAFTQVPASAVVVVQGVNVISQQRRVTAKEEMIFILKDRVAELEETTIVNDGYTKKAKDSFPGSADVVDSKLIKRGVSTNILDRISNLTSGLYFNPVLQTANGSTPADITIRGQSTFYADVKPMIIVDNFPYEGDINNINPNDIENVTILKDAAATAIWGARAGNGVIVITTRREKASRRRTTFSSSITFQPRPDVRHLSMISNADYIDLEKNLYGQGFYASDLTSASVYAPITPVVWLLYAADRGMISHEEANTRIEAMKKYDVRKDIQKYLYQNSLNQQHSLQVSGRTAKADYFVSLGWDRNLANLTGMEYDRLTFRTQGNYTINRFWQLSAGVSYAEGTSTNGNNPGYNYLSYHANKAFYPYARLKDNNGNALPIYADYNPDIIRQTSALGLQDWSYYPVSDINAETNKVKSKDYVVNLGIQYKLSNALHLDINYQLETQSITGNDNHAVSSYFARDLINTYAQVDPATHQLSYPVPPGGIADLSHQRLLSHQGRVQLSYNKYWDSTRNLSLMGGYEIHSLVNSGNSSRLYGLNSSQAPPAINDTILYPSYMTGEPKSIPESAGPFRKIDHFLSFFINGSYTFHRAYTLSVSAREDQANLFGVATNQKGVPLWSVGTAWHLHRQGFFHSNWLSVLTLRGTIGTTGNISRLATAYTTATYFPNGITGTPYPTATIQNPPNGHLRWEVVKIFNLGLDFATKGNVINGSIEYYTKDGTDLLAQANADPTLGVIQNPGTTPSVYRNTASTKGSGIDVELTSRNLQGKFRWSTNYIFSYASSRVTRFSMQENAGNVYLSYLSPNPLPGRPIYGVYSYKWKGLDPHTGDPVGVLNGRPSTNWDSIYNNTAVRDMEYNGPARPTIFGALRNNFGLGRFTMSFNISYKFGYYFRKPSLSYDDLFHKWTGSGDYSKRWQKAGDEQFTYVPGLNYSASAARDLFYINSSVRVGKADHVKFEDINFSYDMDNLHWGFFRCQHLKVFTYLSNLWMIWTANREGIDPDAVNAPREGKRYSLGLSVTF